MSFNVKDAGWFYHAPARSKKSDEPVYYPAMSQIPGLATDDGVGVEDQPRPLFRDTDTKYIRLAKEGGRRNLLQMKENPTEKKEAVGYPRNDWFYLQDNELEDAEKKKETEEQYYFMRPDYMVHQPSRDGNQSYERPQRGPLGYDRLTVFERDGHSATDKTVKLPEVRKVGYGVRSEKPLKIPKTKQVGKPPSAYTDTGGRGTKPLKYLPMQQLIKRREEGPSSGRSGGKSAPAPVRQTETQRLREAKLKKQEEKELFKMTRFKNVPARIDTQRHPVHQQSQQQAQAAC